MLKRFGPFIMFAGLTLGTQFMVFISNILIANNLTMEQFGVYSLIISVVNLLLTICCQWNSSMVHYCGSKEIAEKGNMAQTNLARFILLSLCYIITGVGILIFHKRLEIYLGGKYVLLVYLLVVSKGISEVISAYMIARKKRQLSAVVVFLAELIVIVYLLICKASINIVILVQIISNALFLLLIPCMNKDDFHVEKVDKQYLGYCFKFAIWQLMGSVAIYIISYGDNYIIKLFLSYDQIAQYNAAYKLFTSVFMAANIISSFYVAQLTKALIKNDKVQLKSIFKYDRRVMFILCLILHVLLIIFAKPIMVILYKGKYNSSIIIFRILLMASIIRYWTIFEMMYFNAVGKIKVQQYLNVVSAVLKIVLGFILIRTMGIIGLAISTFISNLITGIASFYFSEKDIKKLYE